MLVRFTFRNKLKYFKTIKKLMKFKIYFRVLVLIIVSSVVFVSCSTKKNTMMTRAYHNLTTHYNVYWNGNNSFNEGKAQLENSILENYNLTLPVFNYGDADNARKIYSQMDRAIEKSEKAISKHSLYFKGKEYNKWIDDCYQLMGQSYFYKKDFHQADRAFDYIIQQFPETQAQLLAHIWKIKTYIEQKRYDECTLLFEQLEAQMLKVKPSYNIRKLVPLVYADYYLKSENMLMAKTFLKQAIEVNNSGKQKARLNFILGQIAQSEKKYSDATKHYSKVIKSSAPNIMIFNAKINMAKSFDIHSGDKVALEKQLNRMLKDIKYVDYKDQVYFALSELSHITGNDSMTIEYLKLSVASSVSNNYQKSSSALILADKLFQKNDYEEAAKYYDTTLQVLPIAHPKYDDIRTKTTTLFELVGNLQIIHFEDSLQRLARMPEAELNKVIAGIIEKYEAEEKARLEAEELARLENEIIRNIPVGDMRAMNTNVVGGGGWYFYNPSAVSMGFSEFTRVWGRRKLEDNWRLSNKQALVTFDNDEPETTDEELVSDSTSTGEKPVKKPVSTDPKNPQTYISQLPRTPEAINASNKKIATALVNLGYIYKDGLEDIPNSVKSFEEYIKRFPTSDNLLTIYYQLYLIGVEFNNPELVQKYSNLVTSNFPDSDYAEIIRNPDYNKELLARKNRGSSLYNEAYNAFSQNQYKLVDLYTKQAIEEDFDSDLTPRFMYLRAVALGEIYKKDSLISNFEKLVKKYPNHPVSQLALETLNIHKSGGVGSQAGSTATAQTNQQTGNETLAMQGMQTSTGDTTVPDIYKLNKNQTHFFITIVNEDFVNATAMKNRISDFATKNFSKSTLSINSIILDKGYQMITVTSFKNAELALDFYHAIMIDDYVMGQVINTDYRMFVISIDNYPIFYRERNFDGYINFFKKHYLN